MKSLTTLAGARYAPGEQMTLTCGCRATVEVRLPARPLLAVRIVAAACGAPAHRVGRRIMTSKDVQHGIA
jgi:hypothetical protein